MQDLGRAALALAFGLVVYAAIGGGLGAYTRRRRLVASARNALFASFGATVVAKDLESGEQVRYRIVGEDEADVKARKISFQSPIARAFVGKKRKERVEVNAPRGVREFQILDIVFEGPGK